MRRIALFTLATAAILFTAACNDGSLPSSPGSDRAGANISDAVHYPQISGDLDRNPKFWWLPPLAPAPDRSGFGTFDPTVHPRVVVRCLDTNDGGCTAGETVARFEIGSGLTVNDSLYIANFDLSKQSPELALSDPVDLEHHRTTYRIEVQTPTFTDEGSLGGPFVFGFADFRVGATGAEATELTRPDSIVGATRNQTLPIKFRLDEGALAFEVQQNTAGLGSAGLCQTNCSVTLLDPDGITDACLSGADGGAELTCLESTPHAVSGLTFLIIDQQTTGPDGGCAPGATLVKDDCFRYVLLGNGGSDAFFAGDNVQPGDPDFVVYGICPIAHGTDVVTGGVIDRNWRLLKADLENGVWQVTAPPETEAPFLQCDVGGFLETALGDGPLGRAAGRLLDWFVSPVEAGHFTGGQLGSLSDLFWGLDAVIEAVEPTTFSVLSGTTVRPTVRIVAVHPDPDHPQPLADMPVTFTVTSGSGTLSSGTETGQTITVRTAADGTASVDLTALGPVGSTVTVEASSTEALLASGVSGAITFTTTIEAGSQAVLYGVNSQDDGLSIIDPDRGKVTHVGTTLDAIKGNYSAPMSMATDANGTLYVWNNSGSSGSNAGSLLAVDRCTGTASRLLSNGEGHFQALTGDAAGSGTFYGLGSDVYTVSVGGTSHVQSLSGLDIAGADVDPVTGMLYGLESTATGGRTGPRLVTIDPGSGAVSAAATLGEDVGTVKSIVFRSDGTLIGSAATGKKELLFYFTTAGNVTGSTFMEHGEHAPEGMAFAPSCPTS